MSAQGHPGSAPHTNVLQATKQFTRRDDSDFVNADDPAGGPPPMANFFVTLLVVFFLGSCCAFLLLICRRRRLSRQAQTQAMLPLHHTPSHQRNTTDRASGMLPPPVYVYEQKQDQNSPTLAVPEIHITFPDEEGGARQLNTTRVVVVRMGDSGSVGMEPLPPYQPDDMEEYQSLDLNHIGGLREKDYTSQRQPRHQPESPQLAL